VNYQSVEEIVNLILTKMEEENESDGYKGYVVKASHVHLKLAC
jgi:hypothetical protein